jgi:RNA recognition motif-containing protein
MWYDLVLSCFRLFLNPLSDPPPTIRLLTPKSSAPGKQATKSKGCAFLEFSHRNALQQALKLHQTEIEGRRINVELTAGGGGKSQSRLSKVKERNKELDGQRVSLGYLLASCAVRGLIVSRIF